MIYGTLKFEWQKYKNVLNVYDFNQLNIFFIKKNKYIFKIDQKDTQQLVIPLFYGYGIYKNLIVMAVMITI